MKLYCIESLAHGEDHFTPGRYYQVMSISTSSKRNHYSIISNCGEVVNVPLVGLVWRFKGPEYYREELLNKILPQGECLKTLLE